MRIYRRKPSKVWWVQWKGQRTSLGTTDETAAQLKFRELQRRDADPTYREADPSATLRAEIDGFIARQREKGRAPGTITMYELHRDLICEALGDFTPIADVDAAAVDRYISIQTQAGDSKSYRWKQLCTLRGTLKRARKLGRYPFALDQVMPDDAQPEYEPLTRHLLLPDVRRLLKALPSRRRAAVAFIVCTGADLGCLERAEAGDVAGGFARVRGSKTKHRDRTVPLLPLFGEIVRLVKPPFERWPNMRRDLARACKKAKVDVVTARDLRRSHGRILRAAGVEPSLIGPMLGHAPGSPVTAKSYAQVTPAELGRLVGGQIKRARKKSHADELRDGAHGDTSMRNGPVPAISSKISSASRSSPGCA